jgi:hypothetical protein
MRWRRRARRRSGWAAWLGIAALVLNALVPVHLAFRLSEALATTYCGAVEASGDNLERRLFALLSLRDETGGQPGHQPGKHHGPTCPVCSALGTLGAAPLPAAAALSLPVPVASSAAPPALAAEPAIVFPAGYRSRAPPAA